jgi:hydroxyacylglutathione hydrolase
MKNNPGSSFYLKQLQVGPMENFIYLIGDTQTRECVMVDPAWDVAQVFRAAEQDDMKVIAGLATHYHYDHTNGIADLIAKANCKVYVNKEDAPYLKDLQKEVTKV